MNTNKGRVLTLTIRIEDPEQAEWIWKAHKEPANGMFVMGIASGDQLKALRVYEDRWESAAEMADLAGEDYIDNLEKRHPLPEEE